MRLRIVLAAVAAALAAPGMAHAAQQQLARPHLYRPNPIFTGIQLDYVQPLPTPTHGVAILPPLSELATRAAVLDMERLQYRIQDDLGGFIPAPIGQLALSSGGREVVGSTKGQAQIPLYQHHAGGKVNAFTFIGSGPGITPGNTDNGKQPVPGLGGNQIPVPVPPATNHQNVPPANGGFSGQGTNGGSKNGSGTGTGTGPESGGGTTARGVTAPRTTTRPTTSTRTTTRQTTTQVTISTTAPTTTAVPATTTIAPTTTITPGGGGGGGGGGGDCGGDGISIVPAPGSPSDCIMKLFGAKPGDEEHEVLTITNVSSAPYTLALKVTGTPNHLWSDLEMGVWENGTPTPSPLPPLSFWTTQYNDLVTLHPGDSISYRIQLYLPVEAGNVDQSLTAILDFNWKGH